MNSLEWLKAAEKKLNESGIGTARLDALVLLEDALRTDRSQLLAYPKRRLTDAQRRLLAAQLKRRSKHEPLAYIRGKSEFYGREFMVDPRVLQPRPETETMIELAKTLSLPRGSVIADIGTGSGCIAVTMALEQPQLTVVATDLDPNCLTVARANARRHKAKLLFAKGDLSTPLKTKHLQPDLIMANLPYVPDSFTVNEAALQEPKMAMYGGGDGLNLYRQLFKQLIAWSKPPGYVLAEALPPQHPELIKVAGKAGYRLKTTDDFIVLLTR